MNKRPMQFLIVALLAAVALSGCQKEPPTVTAAHLVGAWVEVADAQTSPRVRSGPRLSPQMRKITFASDGSFKLTLSKPDGSGEDAGKFIAGTWKLENGSFLLEPNKNTLGDNFKAWAPKLVGMQPPLDEKSPPATECTITHENGGEARYKRL